ncbi:hypothetical protein B566_EDAN006311, partial [Ephemera danica]
MCSRVGRTNKQDCCSLSRCNSSTVKQTRLTQTPKVTRNSSSSHNWGIKSRRDQVLARRSNVRQLANERRDALLASR